MSTPQQDSLSYMEKWIYDFFFNLNCPTADRKDRLISKILKFNLIFVYIKSFEDRIIICIKVHFSQHPRLFSGVQAK